MKEAKLKEKLSKEEEAKLEEVLEEGLPEAEEILSDFLFLTMDQSFLDCLTFPRNFKSWPDEEGEAYLQRCGLLIQAFILPILMKKLTEWAERERLSAVEELNSDTTDLDTN